MVMGSILLLYNFVAVSLQNLMSSNSCDTGYFLQVLISHEPRPPSMSWRNSTFSHSSQKCPHITTTVPFLTVLITQVCHLQR
ncbi:hypothetical protein HD554DRAFT_1843160 [Boletus coccyginus]|nr:hypothetical protein HD554DRAFT_1843160 [Boletus coccyginus]